MAEKLLQVNFGLNVAPAEAAQHHPNIAIVYRWVTLILTTHDEGGVTQKDVDLARAIEVLDF